MQKRNTGLVYICFYLLFSVGAWQIVIGGLATLLIAPYLVSAEMGIAAQIVLSLMLLTCAGGLSWYPARKIAFWLRRHLTTHQT